MGSSWPNVRSARCFIVSASGGYSPELNPVENIWQYLRQNQLSNRVFESYEAILDACCEAWNALIADKGRIKSIASRPWAAVNI